MRHTQEKRSFPMSISGASVLMVLVVLCLVLFGVLSLVTAQSEWKLTQKSTDNVLHYYQSDAQAQQAIGSFSEQVAVLRGGHFLSQAESVLTNTSGMSLLSKDEKSLQALYQTQQNSQTYSVYFTVNADKSITITDSQYVYNITDTQTNQENVWNGQP